MPTTLSHAAWAIKMRTAAVRRGGHLGAAFSLFHKKQLPLSAEDVGGRRGRQRGGSEPRPDVRLLVRPRSCHHQNQFLGKFPVQPAHNFSHLMAMPGVTLANHLAVQHVQRRKSVVVPLRLSS